jgi:phosphoribosylanthranilate isomerase
LGEDFRACRDAVLAAGSEFESPCAVLVDTASDQYGGTGEAVDWSALAGHSRWLGEAPLILAGGLTPDNVAEAIRVVRPHAVDVASGVESSPGKKDHTKVRDFVAAAREAFEQI